MTWCKRADDAWIDQGLKDSGAALQVDASERAFAQTDAGGAGGGVVIGADTEEMAEELGDVGVVADDEDVFGDGRLAQQALELREGGGGGEGVGELNLVRSRSRWR